MLEILFAVLVLILLLILLVMQLRQPVRSAQMLEQQHRSMLTDLHDGLNKQGDRLIAAQVSESERLRTAVGEELRATRDAVNALQAKQDLLRTEMLAQTLAKLAEQGRADQELIQNSFRNATQHLATSIEALSKTVDGRLEQIGGKVNERLDEGFKKTNETFVSVMTRLATIDEAQKKIDGLTTNMVSLQELLGDKRSRGAFGEVQLEALVRNIMPPQSYEMQFSLPNGTRADCVLKLPEPTGMVAVDSKFPLENYHRMFGVDTPAEKLVAEKQFKADIKKHVDDISSKYIIADVTSDGAVMFIPAEAVFAEIHAHHPEVVDYAMQRRVWIVSPTTLMAVLNTARAVMKDVETRKQVHIIKDELGKLGKEFGRFDERMKKLADHIRQAHEDAQDVRTTSQKISKRFTSIEQVELDNSETPALPNTSLD
ncbi:MAG: DNA recombination protein RmuC [Sideroxydans sp.]|nr:DNA recombination protein RmuC [Sideroxydans sp.]